MKAPKKPKFAKQPKKPSDKASEATWANYSKKLDEVNSINAKKIAEYKKAKSQYDAEIKKRDAIKNKAAKYKANLSGI